MLCNAGVIIYLGGGLRKGCKRYCYLSLAYQLFNILLTITDNFGTPDLVYLLYVGTLFVLLLLAKKNFTNSE